MSETTPGPWRVSHHPHDGVFAGSEIVCRCYSSAAIPISQSEANARLIAAAPELLDAAGRVLSVMERGSTITNEFWAAFSALNAAIAKAKGAK